MELHIFFITLPCKVWLYLLRAYPGFFFFRLYFSRIVPKFAPTFAPTASNLRFMRINQCWSMSHFALKLWCTTWSGTLQTCCTQKKAKRIHRHLSAGEVSAGKQQKSQAAAMQTAHSLSAVFEVNYSSLRAVIEDSDSSNTKTTVKHVVLCVCLLSAR